MFSELGQLSLKGAISDEFQCSLMGCLLKPNEDRFPCFYAFTSLPPLKFFVATSDVYILFQSLKFLLPQKLAKHLTQVAK